MSSRQTEVGITRSAIASLSLLVMTACAPELRGRPFDNSSIDFNDANLQRLRTPGELETVADAVASVMESSHASLVKRRATSRGSVVLSFRLAVERVVGSRSTSSGIYAAPNRWFRIGTFGAQTTTAIDYVAYGALFYVELFPIAGGVEIQALRLPVVDGVTSCPSVASRYRDCHPAPPPGQLSFAANVNNRSGISVSGAKEAEVISGLWAQLQRKRWQDAFRASVSDVKPTTNDEVDDAFSQPTPVETEQPGGAR